MDNLRIEPVSDVEAEGQSISTGLDSFQSYEDVMDQLEQLLSPPPLAEKIGSVVHKLQDEHESFYTLFPKFKVSSPIYRWVSPTSKMCGHYEIKLPFVWSEYEIPRFGILVFTAKPSFYTTWEVEFVPWKSEGRSGTKTIDWTKLYYVDFFSPLRTYERILWEAFQNETPPPTQSLRDLRE